ncbi:MAG TPA: anti-sigma factor [Oleiagrimonas sp.]|nr:anti-sigma factor [Oleiagrimonas sp.]
MNDTYVFPSDNDIHAYIDGCLDEAGVHAMEAWLDRHPERAGEIRRWQRDAQQLRAAMGSFPKSAGEPALDPAVIRTRQRRSARTRVAMAAMLVLTLGVGAIGGWQAHGLTAPVATAPMADARQAYRMFATNRHVQFDITQHHAGDLQTWLNEHFRNAPRLPNLHGAGFHPVGGRLLATGSGPAAMVLYEDRRGDAISFYIRPPSKTRGTLPRGQLREGGLATAYWSGNGYNYALVARADMPDIQVIHEASTLAGKRS